MAKLTAESLIAKWGNHTFSTGVYTGEDYQAFQRSFRIVLRSIAENAGFELHKFLPNHYSCSAVLRHREAGKFVYVSIADVRSFRKEWYEQVLYRTMEHCTDWHGGPNHRAELTKLGNAIQRLVE